MSYVPKYTSLDLVRSKVRPRADELTDTEVLYGIEEGERATDDFLIAAGYDIDNLSQKDQKAAKGLATVKAAISLIPAFPTSVEDKRELRDALRSEEELIEKRMVRRTRMPSKVRAVFKRISPGYGRKWSEEA